MITATSEAGAHELSGLGARLVDTNHELLARACDGRFMREVRAGTLASSVFASYLAIERHFVVESAKMLAAAALRSPDEATLIGHLDAAHDLVHEQLDYFERAFERIGGHAAVTSAALDAAGGLAAVARSAVESGEYWSLIVVSFATEHLYSTWCSAALPDVDVTTEIGAWVALHAEPAFARRVHDLADEVDRVTPADCRERADRLYRAVIAAEIEFHEAPYIDAGEAPDE